jgi:A/G-specific adenine glycosylase
LAASRRISAGFRDDSVNAYEDSSPEGIATKRGITRRESQNEENKDAIFEPEAEAIQPPPQKKRRIAVSRSKNGHSELVSILFGPEVSPTTVPHCYDLARRHTVAYHRPLLLRGDSGDTARESLFEWFDSVSADRRMPWRKAWIDPVKVTDPVELRAALEKRAYEVWISEIMLQQTRVAVVIEYWNRWMARWPTIHDLAAAGAEDVLQAWRGLGYYSRATRIHEAAKLVVADADMRGLLPADPVILEAKIPGVGRYTAGAISSIVFGRAEAMVDGNVLRVLSRQLGLLGDVKTDKGVIDLLWGAADALVQSVAKKSGDEDDTTPSDRPGRWGQALMELGSTICTPKPNCAACPIRPTCRAYGEGLARGQKVQTVQEVPPIEDICGLCQPLEVVDDEEEENSEKQKTSKEARTKLSGAFKPTGSAYFEDNLTITAINHARRFPLKRIKKAVREEETIVCAISRPDGKYLLRRRPEKGLLAGLWELPSCDLPTAAKSKVQGRKSAALEFVLETVGSDIKKGKPAKLKHLGELGMVPWVFSHLKLGMHVHGFLLDSAGCAATDDGDVSADKRWRWADAEEIDDESMGTGMRKCWALVKEAVP